MAQEVGEREADSVDLLCRVQSTAFLRLPAVKSTAKLGPNKLQSVLKGVGERAEETNLAAERSQFGLLASFHALQPRQSPFPKRGLSIEKEVVLQMDPGYG